MEDPHTISAVLAERIRADIVVGGAIVEVETKLLKGPLERSCVGGDAEAKLRRIASACRHCARWSALQLRRRSIAIFLLRAGRLYLGVEATRWCKNK